MKATLFALFVALLLVGCGEQNQSVGSDEASDLPILPSFNPNESKFERTKRLAEGGDKAAQFNLGYMYDGEGVPEDDKEAVKWYTKSAEQGDAVAQFNLGYMYYLEKDIRMTRKQLSGTPSRPSRGIPWLSTTLG